MIFFLSRLIHARPYIYLNRNSYAFQNIIIVPIPIFGKIGDSYQNLFDALTSKTEIMSLKIQSGVYIL